MKITDEMILNDIAGFEKRIQVAKDKLDSLPGGKSLTWQQKKKCRAKRSDLDGEIAHVLKQISIARSAISE